TILQTGSLASFITALYTDDLPLLGRSLHDYIVEPQRKQLIKGFDDVQQAALDCGALGCSISGAGPSVFALCDSGYLAQAAGQAMQAAFTKHKVTSQLYVSPINQDGVIIL
ncbi:MAG: homoserine kinase, partial [Bacteroidota bacterium]